MSWLCFDHSKVQSRGPPRTGSPPVTATADLLDPRIKLLVYLEVAGKGRFVIGCVILGTYACPSDVNTNSVGPTSRCIAVGKLGRFLCNLTYVVTTGSICPKS